MEKDHIAAGGPFFGVRRRGVFTQLCLSPPPIFGRFYTVLPVAASKIGFLSVIESPDHRAFIQYNTINILDVKYCGMGSLSTTG